MVGFWRMRWDAVNEFQKDIKADLTQCPAQREFLSIILEY